MVLTHRFIRLTYCYLTCFVLVLCMLFTVHGLIGDFIRWASFNETYTCSGHLTAETFSKTEAMKNLSPDDIEKRRQAEIVSEKKRNRIWLKNSICQSLLYALLLSILLCVHIFLIRYQSSRELQ